LTALVVAVGAPVAMLSGSVSAAGADTACPAPRCTDVVVPTPPQVHVTDTHVRILLPVGYGEGSRRYPVLYLLHGAGDTYTSWTTKTDVTAFSSQFPVIIVMPDAGHNSQAGWYSDWKDGTYQWETYHLGLLMPWVDRHLRTIRNDDAVAGLSMGGFGAMSYAARHPGLYRAAASFSGAVDTEYGAPASGVAFDALHDQYGTPNEEVWGNQLSDGSTWAAHDPTALAAKLSGTQLFIASGTGTPGGSQGEEPTNPGGYALENGVFQMNLQFVRALDAAGVAHHDHFYPGGVHDWPYWQADLHWALPQIVTLLGRSR
jgi:S-formylglutathione hydrolase FrmB